MDGEWLLYTNPREDVAMAIANRIKFLAGLDSHDSSISKLGHIRVAYKDFPEFLLSVTMLPIGGGSESIVLKLPTT